jgi:hypothetical protein
MTARTKMILAVIFIALLTLLGLYCAYGAAFFAWCTALPQANIPRMQHDCYVYFFSGVAVGILWFADAIWIILQLRKPSITA